GGVTWILLKLTHYAFPTLPFVRVDPSNPSTVYAFDELHRANYNFYRSTDSGASWTDFTMPSLSNNSLFPPPFNDLVIVPPASSGTSGPPAISANGVVNGASLQPGFAANSWATIFGTNLASTTDNWNSSIVNGKLPTVVDGVSVTMGGK